MFRDQLGRELNLETTPKRVVSLVPSITELLCDLELQDNLVGVTKFCVHPADIRSSSTIVGGTKNPKLDKIRGLAPDIVIANKEENNKADIEAIAEFCTVYVSDINTIEDSINLVSDFGEIFNVESRAKQLQNGLSNTYNALKTEGRKLQGKKVLYLIWQKPFMAAGTDVFITQMLALFNCENVLESLGGNGMRYPELSDAAIRQLNPDLIMLSSEPYPFKAAHVADFESRFGIKTILVDGELFSWYGSRILKCFPSISEIATDIRGIFR